jgi:hypothetical protein
MHTTPTSEELENDIMKTMLYFDIFHYPLKADEVFHFLQRNSVTREHVATSLAALSLKNRLYRFDTFFSLRERPDTASRRVRGNDTASRMLPLAQKRAKLIATFPFVRAVLASGSFSKNYMDENSDLDFFIITAPGHLWFCRTLLVLYKRLFLHNSHKFFCVNYFIDEDHLEIHEKNLFTATELATLLPLTNASLYSRLIRSNSWVKSFFPNFIERDCSTVSETATPLQRLIEMILFPMAIFSERFCRYLNVRRWRSLYESKYSGADFKVAFKSDAHASKNHPNNYQKQVMIQYRQKLSDHKLLDT